MKKRESLSAAVLLGLFAALAAGCAGVKSGTASDPAASQVQVRRHGRSQGRARVQIQAKGGASQIEVRGGEGMAAAAPAMMQAGTPGGHHRLLDRFVGSWKGTFKMRMAPDAPWMTFEGDVEREWVLDGRFLHEVVKADSPMGPFEGISYMGYDDLEGRYVMIWMDSTATTIYSEAGYYDAEKQLLRTRGSMRDPASGKIVIGEGELDLSDPDRQVFKGWTLGADGRRFFSMEGITERRAQVVEKPSFPNKPFVSWTGAHSSVAEPGFQRITGDADWIDLWLEHKGRKVEGAYDRFYNPSGVPVVDFDHCMVLAVFLGEQWNCAGIRIVSIREEKEALRVRFEKISYQTLGSDGGGEKTVPFGFFVLPATGKTMILEENVQGLKGGQPAWKERARLR